MPPGRGGPQRIPRPSDALLGGPPPWSSLAPAERRVTLPSIEAALEGRSPRVRGPVPDDARHSGVLVVLYDAAPDGEGGDPRVVLTRRSRDLRHHAHEIAFPGGRHEPGDADLWATAVREATEEVGLDPAAIRRVGELDGFMTVGSRTLVQPFVAVVDGRPDLVADPVEVESIRHVALAELLRVDVWREELWSFRQFGGTRAITFFELEGDTVWGATGAMLRQLLALATGVDDAIAGGPG